jgi:hypothetical protein
MTLYLRSPPLSCYSGSCTLSSGTNDIILTLTAAVLLLGLLLALYKRWQQVPSELRIYLQSCGT